MLVNITETLKPVVYNDSILHTVVSRSATLSNNESLVPENIPAFQHERVMMSAEHRKKLADRGRRY